MSWKNFLFVLCVLIFLTCKRELKSVDKTSDISDAETKENFALLELKFKNKDIILISDLNHIEVAEPNGIIPIIHAVASADVKINTSDILVTTDKTVFHRIEEIILPNTKTRVFYIILSSRIQNLVSAKYALHINAPSTAQNTKLLKLTYGDLEIDEDAEDVFFSKTLDSLNTFDTLSIEFMDPMIQDHYQPIFSENAQVFITQITSLDTCNRKKYNVISADRSEESVYMIEACTAPILKNIEIDHLIYTPIEIKNNYSAQRELVFRVKNRVAQLVDLKINYLAVLPKKENKKITQTTEHAIWYELNLTSNFDQKIDYLLKTHTEIQFAVQDLSLTNAVISNITFNHAHLDVCTDSQDVITKEQIQIQELEGLTYLLSQGNTANQWKLNIANGLDEPKDFVLSFHANQPQVSTYKIEENNGLLWKKKEDANNDFDYQEETAFEDWTFTNVNSPKCLTLNSIKYPEIGGFQIFDHTQGWIKTKRQDSNFAYRQWLELVSCGQTYAYCIDFKPIDLILQDITLSDSQAFWKIETAVVDQLNPNLVDNIWQVKKANIISESPNLQIDLKFSNDPRQLVTQTSVSTKNGKKITLNNGFKNPPQIEFSVFKAIPLELWADWQLLEQWSDKKFEIINNLISPDPIEHFVVNKEFKGELNGNDKTITWQVIKTAEQTALFQKLNQAKVFNLKIKNLNLTVKNQIAPIALEAQNSIFENIRLEQIVLQALNISGFVYKFVGRNNLKNIFISDLTIKNAELFAGLAADVQEQAEINLEKILIHDLAFQNLSANSFVSGLLHNQHNISYNLQGKLISLTTKNNQSFGTQNKAVALLDRKQGITNLSDISIHLILNTNGFFLINSVQNSITKIENCVIYQSFMSSPKLIGNVNQQTTGKVIYHLNHMPQQRSYLGTNNDGIETAITNNEEYGLNSSNWEFNNFPNLPVLKSFD